MIVMKIEKVPGDCQIPGFSAHFTLTSCSFGIERELNDSAKAGTADITFGVGTLQDLSIGKTMDFGSADLAKYAIRGATVGTVEIKFIETTTVDDNVTANLIFLWIRLDKAFVKTWSISGSDDGRPEEELALWYNKIAFRWFATTDGKTVVGSPEFMWDHVTNREWTAGKSVFGKNEDALVKDK